MLSFLLAKNMGPTGKVLYFRVKQTEPKTCPSSITQIAMEKEIQVYIYT